MDLGESGVVVRDARKSYRAGQPVLQVLDMTVPSGAIYGLLGSSGCGKTTLLSALVGLHRLDSGQVWLFGHRPGDQGLCIPGRNVGYMPQDIALHPEFSIGETLSYFGTLAGMRVEEVHLAKKHFLNLLQLPRSSRRVGELSGGQQRRVSLVAALMGQPKLLILDEPTVGVDPLVCQSIWDYLKNLSRDKRTTVVITTHYIEECRKADFVGIMRGGRLLEERRVDELMKEHGGNNLEQIVLSLTRKDAAAQPPPACKDGGSLMVSAPPQMAEISNRGSRHGGSFARIKAIVRKNFAKLCRNLILLFFAVGLPPVVMTVTGIALARTPNHLPVGLVNLEGNCANFTQDGTCSLEMLSCQFLQNLEDSVLDLVPFDLEEEALAAVHSGWLYGYLLFPPGFSSALSERVWAGSDWDGDELGNASSSIRVHLDETPKLIASTIRVALYEGFERFVKEMLGICGWDPKLGEHSLRYRPPLLGWEGGGLQEYVLPGLALVTLGFYPLVTSSFHLIREKRSGLLHRSFVAGVRTWEMLVAYAISELGAMALHTLFNYWVMTYLFGVEVVGDDSLLLGLFFLTGYMGVSMGFLFGSVCNEEIEAALLALSVVVPNMILTGVLWPFEGSAAWLQYVTQLLPLTLPSEAARSITSRGWDWSHPHVWSGFAALTGHILAYSILTVLFHALVKR